MTNDTAIINLIKPVRLYKSGYGSFWIHCPTSRVAGGTWNVWTSIHKRWGDGPQPDPHFMLGLRPSSLLEFLIVTGRTFDSTVEEYFGLKESKT